MEVRVHHKPGLNSKTFRSMYVEKGTSDGDVKPGGPLGAFREEQAMSRHRVSPSPHHHLTQHNYTIQTVTHTVIITSTSSSTLYRYSSHT